MPEIAFSPRARKSPYFGATIEAGATAFSIYNHTYFPMSYGSMEQEYWHLLNKVAVWDVACQIQIELRGPQAGELAQLLSARNLAGTEVGQGRYVPMCDHEGRLLNDPLVLRVAEDQWWFSIADSDMLAWCRAIGAERRLEVDINELDVAPLAVQGPLAADVVADLMGEWTRDLGFFRYAPAEVDGIALLIGRAGYSTKGGFELYLQDTNRGHDLWTRIMAAGEPYGIAPGTPNHMERIESAFISIRTDTDDNTDPFEARLGRYVSFDPGLDYIGRPALEAKQRAGLQRELVGLVIDGERQIPNTEPLPVHQDTTAVGQIRSMVWSPRLETMIALAIIDAPHNQLGTKLAAATTAGERVALVTELPFI